jgi:hypothetical protein
VAQALSDNQWIRDITSGLSVTTMVQYLHLWDRLQAIQLDPEREDVVRWMWTPDGNYSARSAYLLMHHGNTTFPGTDLLWGSWAPLRVKLFLWLACRKRVWTADQRLRRGLDTHTICLLCDQENETVDHILVSCSWAKEVWWSSCSWAGCVCSLNVAQTLQEWWEHMVLAQPARRRSGTSIDPLHADLLAPLEGEERQSV